MFCRNATNNWPSRSSCCLGSHWMKESYQPIGKQQQCHQSSRNWVRQKRATISPLAWHVSHPCNTLETLIGERMLDHAKVNNLLNDNQHGFMHGKSCLTNQLETPRGHIATSLDEGNCMDIISLDYQKAFDSVTHRRLLSTLNSYGYRGKVLKWVESFLIGRTQKVTVRGATSSKAVVVSGVPQWSVLGSILFILYINDLPELVSSRFKMFADDTEIYGPATTENEAKAIQDDLEKLQLWSEKWLLKFLKCRKM